MVKNLDRLWQSNNYLNMISFIGGILFWLAGGYYIGGTIKEEITENKKTRNLLIFSAFFGVIVSLILK